MPRRKPVPKAESLKRKGYSQVRGEFFNTRSSAEKFVPIERMMGAKGRSLRVARIPPRGKRWKKTVYVVMTKKFQRRRTNGRRSR